MGAPEGQRGTEVVLVLPGAGLPRISATAAEPRGTEPRVVRGRQIPDRLSRRTGLVAVVGAVMRSCSGQAVCTRVRA